MSDIPVDATVLLSLIFISPVVALLLTLSALFVRVAKRYGAIPAERRVWVERRRAWVPSAAFLAIYAGSFLYGHFVELNWVEETRTEVRVAQPVLGRDRFRIVHLSDLHLERIGRREARVLELVRDARPDLILLTGDYINVREGGAALDEMLTAFRQIAPVYGVPGNWDSKFVTEEIFRRAGRATLAPEELEKSPCALICDDSVLIERDGKRLRLVGQEVHSKKPLRELLRGLDDGAYTIFMHHKPDAVDELRGRAPGQRVDLFLCGHTHGGQVRLPFWGAVITFAKYHKRYERGLYDVEGVPMYVSSGVGCEGGSSPRVRFLCRPEVAVLDLLFK